MLKMCRHPLEVHVDYWSWHFIWIDVHHNSFLSSEVYLQITIYFDAHVIWSSRLNYRHFLAMYCRRAIVSSYFLVIVSHKNRQTFSVVTPISMPFYYCFTEAHQALHQFSTKMSALRSSFDCRTYPISPQ